MDNDPIFRVIFSQEDKTYEIYAKEIDDEVMMGFVCLGDLQLGSVTTSVVVDPAIEKLKEEFSNVKRIYIPAHMLLRIDEMEKVGVSTVKPSSGSSNVHELPTKGGSVTSIKKD